MKFAQTLVTYTTCKIDFFKKKKFFKNTNFSQKYLFDNFEKVCSLIFTYQSFINNYLNLNRIYFKITNYEKMKNEHKLFFNFYKFS